MARTWYAQMEVQQLTSLKPPSKASHPHCRAFSTSPFIHPLSQYAFPSAQSSIVASKASQTLNTKWWEADKPGKQTSHSPMLHIMFPDLTAHDVSFPKHTRPQKKKKGKKKAKEVQKPVRVQVTKVGGWREHKDEQCQRHTLKRKRNKQGKTQRSALVCRYLKSLTPVTYWKSTRVITRCHGFIVKLATVRKRFYIVCFYNSNLWGILTSHQRCEPYLECYLKVTARQVELVWDNTEPPWLS